MGCMHLLCKNTVAQVSEEEADRAREIFRGFVLERPFNRTKITFLDLRRRVPLWDMIVAVAM
eukprot:8900441-Karenia_brevis.AAC.1